MILRSISRGVRCCPLVAGGPAVVQACASCVAAFVWWSHGKSLAFSVVCWSNGKSLAFSVPRLVLRYISRVVWGSGGPTTTLSRIPWSGCPAVNLSRYPLLSAGCRWFKRFTGNAAGRTSKMTPTWLQNVAPKHPEAPRSTPKQPEAPRSTPKHPEAPPTVNLSRYPLLSAGCRWPRGEQRKGLEPLRATHT